MPTVLCFNPGSNSLKFDVIAMPDHALRAGEGCRLIAANIDNIGKDTKIEVYREKEKILARTMQTSDFPSATAAGLQVLAEVASSDESSIDLAAVRVVHGGNAFTKATWFNASVRDEIAAREELAPLHNINSLHVIGAIQQSRPGLRIAVAFDTAFHHTLPERSWRYPIDPKLADKHRIRRYGFHGLSHRYLFEQYAYLTGRPMEEINIITTHLESGCSITAIQNGHSIETSMGFTPLEGLMMGTRSGNVDPAILPFLMKHEELSADDALDILEKRSGLLGISGVSLDTRVLRTRKDQASKLAMEIFSYRLRQMVGAYLAVLGSAEAIVFGGGIGENTPEVRQYICDGLRAFGIALDDGLNKKTLQGDVCISNADSKIALWALHTDEAMQLAYECATL